MMDETVSFTVERDKNIKSREILKEVYNALQEKGYNPINQIVGYILYIAKILVPLILIILGTIDFAKATISSDDKAPKDALAALVRRIIIAVIIFLIL